MFINSFFRKSYRLWDNVKKFGRAGQRDHKIIRRLHFMCWTTKATKTHSEYAILTAFPRRRWLHEGASLLRIRCLSCYLQITMYFTVDVWGTGGHRCEYAICCSVGMLSFSARHTLAYTRHIWLYLAQKARLACLSTLWPTKPRAFTTLASSVLKSVGNLTSLF
jgi:hypothetical protein